MDKERDFFGDVLKIALGIAVGVMILWIIAAAVLTAGVQEMDREARKALAAQAQQNRVDQANREAAQRLQRIREAERRKQELIKKAELTALVTESVRREEHAAAVKAAAWGRFYQPSAQCLAEASVECGNAYIRAQGEFERRWRAGELR